MHQSIECRGAATLETTHGETKTDSVLRKSLRLLACAGAWTRLGNTDAVGSYEAGLSPVGPSGGVL